MDPHVFLDYRRHSRYHHRRLLRYFGGGKNGKSGIVKAIEVNQSKLYPFKFKPIYKELIWGGQKLREFFGKDIPAGKKIGESWELADLPNDKSIIANGKLAGQTLSRAIKEFPREIMGDKNFRGPFPLLIKFIDAEEILSIQVHPDAQSMPTNRLRCT